MNYNQKWNILSNKGSVAPWVYISLQIILLTGAIATSEYLRKIELDGIFLMFIFWADVVVAIIFYFLAHLKDPGYVPNDPAFFIALEKEQEDELQRKEGSEKTMSKNARKAEFKNTNEDLDEGQKVTVGIAITTEGESEAGADFDDVTKEEKASQKKTLDPLIHKSTGKRGDSASHFEKVSRKIASEKGYNRFTDEPDGRENERELNKQTSTKKLDEGLSPEDLNLRKTAESLSFHVEKRFCSICGFDLPFRAKHCKDCNRCIASYDHHCPWIGTCVGEKNHLFFFWFLFFQLIEAFWVSLDLIRSFASNDNSSVLVMWIRLATLIIVLLFLIMTGALFFYHGYLATQMLTTWEYLSWHKISYLKEWPEERGSPFTMGCWKNIEYFCCHSYKKLRIWKFPKIRPDQPAE